MEQQQQLNKERNTLLKRIEQVLEGPMIFLGFVWLILLIVELIWGLTPFLDYLSLAIWGIFIIDFILKFFLAPLKKTYLKKNWLTAISLVIPALRVFRIARFIRLLRGLRSFRLVKIVASLNRSMRSLSATMKRRGMLYVVILTLVVIFAGGAAMFAFEKESGGFKNYGEALWWTAMLIISIGSEYWPKSVEGRSLCFLLSLYGFSIFGYITASLASFFVGRDAEEKDAPIASTSDVAELKKEIQILTQAVLSLKNNQTNKEA